MLVYLIGKYQFALFCLCNLKAVWTSSKPKTICHYLVSTTNIQGMNHYSLSLFNNLNTIRQRWARRSIKGKFRPQLNWQFELLILKKKNILAYKFLFYKKDLTFVRSLYKERWSRNLQKIKGLFQEAASLKLKV